MGFLISLLKDRNMVLDLLIYDLYTLSIFAGGCNSVWFVLYVSKFKASHISITVWKLQLFLLRLCILSKSSWFLLSICCKTNQMFCSFSLDTFYPTTPVMVFFNWKVLWLFNFGFLYSYTVALFYSHVCGKNAFPYFYSFAFFLSASSRIRLFRRSYLGKMRIWS